jgi:hypothetical protein
MPEIPPAVVTIAGWFVEPLATQTLVLVVKRRLMGRMLV